MARKPQIIDFEAEAKQHIDALRSQVGQPVPLSCSYIRGQRPTLLAVDGDRATLKYPWFRGLDANDKPVKTKEAASGARTAQRKRTSISRFS